MNQYTRDNIILGVLISSVILWSIIGVGFLITFGATWNPIFLFLSALFIIGAVLAGRAYNAFVVEVRAKPEPRMARGHRRHAQR